MLSSQILLVIIGAIAVTIFAEKRGLQAPLIVTAVGIIVSFIPVLTSFELEPETILSVVVPPLLYSATLDFSFFSFLKRLGSIVNLGVLLVVVTTVVVGFVAEWIVPELTLPAAMVLAAVISPPDAVTAVAIGGRLGLPNRLMTILKGESLVNDAAALTLFSVTVSLAAGTSTFISNPFLFFLYGAVVGILVGILLGFVVQWIRERLSNATLMTALGVLVPFTAYLLAEELHASGVLAVVASGFWLGHHASKINYASRIQERDVWNTIDVLLEAFVFAYIGLQFRFVLGDAHTEGYNLTALFIASFAILLAVMLVRIGWVFLTKRYTDMHLALRKTRKQRWSSDPLSWRECGILAWTGMRGVVTLAAAAGIPLLTAAGEPFPGRAAIQTIAMVVAVGTLLLQGSTLPWLIRRLSPNDPSEAAVQQQQLAYANQVVRDAALSTIHTFVERQTSEENRRVAEFFLERAKQTYTERRQLMEELAGTEHHRPGAGVMAALGQDVLTAQRDALIAERDADRLDDEVMRTVLEQLDLQEAAIFSRSENRL